MDFIVKKTIRYNNTVIYYLSTQSSFQDYPPRRFPSTPAFKESVRPYESSNRTGLEYLLEIPRDNGLGVRSTSWLYKTGSIRVRYS